MSDVLVEADGPVRIITINRPQKKNALHIAAWDALRDALDDAQADPTVGAIVLTGAGDAFCAGVDLSDFNDPTAFDGVDMTTQGYPGVMRALLALEVPLVAAVNGVGVGFGMTVLPFCDVVFIADHARLKVPFVDMGVTTEGAASLLLRERVGWQDAARLIMTGDWLSAAEAVEIGLAWKALPVEEVVPAAREMATRIAGTDIDSVRTSKRLMLASRGDAVAAANDREQREFARMMKGMAG